MQNQFHRTQCESQRDRLKINEPVNAGALRYCLTAYALLNIQSRESKHWITELLASPLPGVSLCVCVFYVRV